MLDVEEFRRKYGTNGLPLVVEEFVRRAPAFEGDKELASQLGRMLGDLEWALGGRPLPSYTKELLNGSASS